MRNRTLLALALALAAVAGPAAADDYTAMLAYLTHSRVDGNALSGANGAIALNIAAGDLNQQANLRAIANGDAAAVHIAARQQQSGNRADAPRVSTASIGGQALAGASGLMSINQASGVGNSELNTAGIVLAQQGIREATTDPWLASVCACTQQAATTDPQQPAPNGRVRAAAVEADALQGAQGVVQLNQIAGSNNLTANHLLLDVGVTPR